MLAEQFLAAGWITAATARAIGELDEHFDSFSGPVNAHLWRFEALADAAEWRTARELAEAVLHTI